MSDRFAHLVDEIDSFVESAAVSPQLNEPDVRVILRFVSQVITVVEQSFQDVLSVLIEIKLLRPADLQSGHVDELRRSVAMLTARSRFRDALEVCSKLKHLGAHYHEFIRPIVDRMNTGTQWWGLLNLINEHEGAVIRLIEESAMEMDEMLADIDERKLPNVRDRAAQQTVVLKAHLGSMHDLNAQILGLSGKPGFIELTTNRRELKHKVTIYMDKPDLSTNTQNVTFGDNNVFGGDVNIVNVLNGKFNTGRAAGNPELQRLLKELTGDVGKMLPQLGSEEERKDVRDALSTLIGEAKRDQPRQKWYEVSAEGLKEAAKTCAAMAGPIVKTVNAILPLLA